MRTFDVQGIEIQASRTAVFAYIRDPRNLPKWAHAFRRADDERATLATPNGSVEVGLSTELEGALDAQRVTLQQELAQLKRILEAQ